MHKRITIINVSSNDPDNLFAVGSHKDEFYFIKPPGRGKALSYFEWLYGLVRGGTEIKIEALVSGRTAELLIPRGFNPSEHYIEGRSVTNPKSQRRHDGIYKENAITLSYTGRNSVLIEPYYADEGFSDMVAVVRGHHYALERTVSRQLRNAVKAWRWVLDIGPRDISYEFSDRIEHLESEDNISDSVGLSKKILEDIVSEKIHKVCDTVSSKRVDLVIMGLYTPENASCLGEGPGDLCIVDRNGSRVARELRVCGYSGAIVAVRPNHRIPDTSYNRECFNSLFRQNVVLSSSARSESLQRILEGGRAVSDYRLGSF
jgi:hypothetical protein